MSKLIDVLREFVTSETSESIDQHTKTVRHGEPDDGRLLVGREDGCDYASIQAAVDAAKSLGGRTVDITPSHDDADENYPVLIDSGMTVEGYERTTCRLNPPSGTSAFKIVEEGKYNDAVTIRNLEIKGGDPAIEASGNCYLLLESLMLINPEGTGVHVHEMNTKWDSVENTLRDVAVVWGQGDGFVFDGNEACNAFRVENCSINNVEGRGMVLNGASTNVEGSVIQSCGREAIYIRDGLNISITDNYFEKNGRNYVSDDNTNTYAQDIVHKNARGTTIARNYAYSMGTSHRFLGLYSGEAVNLRSITYNGYEKREAGGLVAVFSNATDCDIYESTHSGKAPVVVQDANGEFDYGKRTRSHGIIRKDLKELEKVVAERQSTTEADSGN